MRPPPNDGVSYGLPTESAKGVGEWISLGSETLRLAARASVRVPFTVAVPSGAVSGEHLGGLGDLAAEHGRYAGSKAGASTVFSAMWAPS